MNKNKIRAALEAAKESLEKISEEIEGGVPCCTIGHEDDYIGNAVLPSEMEDAGFPKAFTLIEEALAELDAEQPATGGGLQQGERLYRWVKCSERMPVFNVWKSITIIDSFNNVGKIESDRDNGFFVRILIDNERTRMPVRPEIYNDWQWLEEVVPTVSVKAVANAILSGAYKRETTMEKELMSVGACMDYEWQARQAIAALPFKVEVEK